MSARLRHIALALAALLLLGEGARGQLVPNLGGQRAGISAFQFLKLGVGARAVGMGESFVAVASDASALYWNPAGLVQFSENQLLASHTEYLADIKHEFVGLAYHLTGQDAVGISVVALHMKDMEITTESQPFGTGTYFSYGDLAVGLSYGRKMTDQFSFGVTVKYVQETLDLLKMRSMVVDLGTLYWTGLGTTRFAVTISNFGANATPKGSVTQFSGADTSGFQSFSVPTVFRLGFAMEPLALENHRVTASVQLNHPNDNSEHVRLGMEYAFQETFFLRLGVKRTIGQKLLGEDQTSEESLNAGAGVQVALGPTTVGADYAYADYSRLGSVHRLSLLIKF